MAMSVDELITMSKNVGLAALDGCPADTYKKMTALIEQIIAIAPSMKDGFIHGLNEVIKNLLEAQKVDDLNKIYDFVTYEMVYLLNNYKK